MRAPEGWGARLIYNLKAVMRGAAGWLRIVTHRPNPRERRSAKIDTRLPVLTGPTGFLLAAFVADALEILVAWEAEIARWALMRGRRLGLPYERQRHLLHVARQSCDGDAAALTIPTRSGEWIECYILLGERMYPKVAGLIWRSWPGRTSSAISGGFISTPFGKMHYCRRDLTRLPEPENEDKTRNLPF